MQDMTQLNQIYKCNVCGNMVEVLHTGVGQLVCCGQPMELMAERTQEIGESAYGENLAILEKHVPVIEKIGDGLRIVIGEKPHPMQDNHYIEWIEIIYTAPDETGPITAKKFLKPSQAPQAEFNVSPGAFTARAYCNIHGLWKLER